MLSYLTILWNKIVLYLNVNILNHGFNLLVY
jgi:hypothetical protein